jgi:hypothetical protein
LQRGLPKRTTTGVVVPTAIGALLEDAALTKLVEGAADAEP